MEKLVLGIDEVGRGPWAGPLVVGAVVLPSPSTKNTQNSSHAELKTWQQELADSKKLTAKKRERLAPIIEQNAKAYGLGWVSAKELDQKGMTESLKLATRRAVQTLLALVSNNPTSSTTDTPTLKNLPTNLPFTEIIIDGTINFLKGTPLENLSTILPKADAKIRAVSAASIIAKVARDNYMKKLAEKYPAYGFEKHVGYGTKQHQEALEKFGPCLEHRQSFAPIKNVINYGVAKPPKNTNLAKDLKPLKTARPSKVNIPLNSNSASQLTATDLGSRAEQVVANYLIQKGHKIIARNYKTKFYEIDIVSATKDHLYFTEVKYRRNSTHGSPLEFIDTKKQKQITFAAESFTKYLSKRLNRPTYELPSPILAAAAVEGKEFKLANWTPIVV